MTETNKGTTLVVPGFRLCKEIKLSNVARTAAVSRMNEAENLIPANYNNLEFDFQAAWREARLNAITVGAEIKRAHQNIDEIKADIILDEIPKLMVDLPKSANNADFRKAVFSRNEDYTKSVEHLNMLETMLLHYESHMKSMEKISSSLKKQMDYIIRNGSYGG